MSFEKRFLGIFILLISVFVAGCTPPSDPLLDMLDADLNKTRVDDLSRTMDFVSSEIRFAQDEFKDKISTGLNRWASTDEERIKGLDEAWKEDSLVGDVFEANQSLPMLARNAELSFLSTDGYFLQESAWTSQIAKRVIAEGQLSPFELYRLAADDFKPDEEAAQPLAEVMLKLHPELDADKSVTLANSLCMFDWVVRNIQLSPEVELSEENSEEAMLTESDEGLAASGVPGLGYTHYPWQTLLYGRGDYVERAKLVMLGLRHLDIDSVMLATKSTDGTFKPWAIGVVVGDEYYLFDTKLGLPIPGETVGSIATLAQVRKNPKLLASLDLTTDESLEVQTEYWVKSDQLESLKGYIYVTPESVSKRMLGLERALSADERLVLAFNADEISARLPKAKGLNVKAWSVAFDTHQYRQAVRVALEQASNDVLADKLSWHYTDEYYIDNFVVYRTARARFFKGKFDVDVDGRSLNAIQSCQRLNYTEDQVENLGSDRKQQLRLGIRQEDSQTAQEFNQQVTSVQAQMRLIRRDAGLFLSQCLFDKGNMTAAANWLLILKKEGAGRWGDGVTYLLGRSHEKLKDYDQAIEVMSDQKLNQSHGNLIRIRMLKELIAKLDAEGVESAEPAAKEPAAKEPAAKEPAAKEPAAKEPAAKEPAAKEPAAK
ncbi:MAG: hypothetical protein ACI814_004374, partial [Mariniblastus sp.]